MKKQIFGILITLSGLFLLPTTALADINTSCFLSQNSNFWIPRCEIGVFMHPVILGVTDVKSESSQVGSWYLNGIYQATLGPVTNTGTGGITVTGNPSVMNGAAFSITYATKYLYVGPPPTGITWDELCVDGEFSSKSLGVWTHDPNFDQDWCDYLSTE